MACFSESGGCFEVSALTFSFLVRAIGTGVAMRDWRGDVSHISIRMG